MTAGSFRGVVVLASIAVVLLTVGCTSVVPSGTQVTTVCAGPPIVDGSPMSTVLTCERGVSAAIAALPAGRAGRDNSFITSIGFGYGHYCPFWMRCPPFTGPGDIGFVVFRFADGSSWYANVKADANGSVSTIDVGPEPTPPWTAPSSSALQIDDDLAEH